MTFDLISGLHMQIQTWHPPLWLCTHAKYYVKSGITNVLKMPTKPKYASFFLFGLPTNRSNNYLRNHRLRKDSSIDYTESCHRATKLSTYVLIGETILICDFVIT